VFRIHIDTSEEATTFMLEGRLVGPWVRELENCWQRALATEPRRSVLVNLQEVSFVDSAGIAVLTRMCRHGVRLMSTGIMMNAIVEAIEREADKTNLLEQRD
jgi:anti-anti-sigma factor